MVNMQCFCDMAKPTSDWLWEQDVAFRFTHFFITPEVTPSSAHIELAGHIGKTLWELPHDGVTEETWRVHRAVLAAHQPFHEFTIKLQNAGGSFDCLSICGNPVFDVSGAFQGYRGTCKNISEHVSVEVRLREVNAELEQRVALLTQRLKLTNRELEALYYSLSHDLRAPLRGINGFSQILLTQHAGQLDASSQDYLQRIHRASLRLGELINALLMLAQITRDSIHREFVDFSQMARHILAELRAAAPERKVEVEIEDGIVVEGDSRLLRIALDSLLNNAWKFTSKNACASICFGSAAHDGVTEIFVRDNGVGFDPKYAGKLFSAFQRLHSEKEYSGIGIGLAMVQRVVHAHGGQIRAEAQPGAGATFYFTVAAHGSNGSLPNQDSAMT